MEDDETVTLGVVGDPLRYQTDGAAPAEVIIHDDPPVVTITEIDAEGNERPTPVDPGAITFRVARTGGDLSRPLTVLLGVLGGAVPGLDYSGLSFRVTDTGADPDTATVQLPGVVPGNASYVDLVLTPIADSEAEPDEYITLFLDVAPDPADSDYLGAYLPDAVAYVAEAVIHDPASRVTIAADVPSAAEAGLSPAAFTVTRDGGDWSQELRVYLLLPQDPFFNRAAPGFDYTGLQWDATYGYFVAIPAGEASLTFPITPRADNLIEGDEWVILLIDDARGGAAYYAGSPDYAAAVIADDPSVVTLVLVGPVAREADLQPGSIQVTRTGGDASQPLTVYFTVSGSASPGSDFGSLGGAAPAPFTFAANETIAYVTVTPVQDGVAEPTETVVSLAEMLSP